MSRALPTFRVEAYTHGRTGRPHYVTVRPVDAGKNLF